MGRQIPLLVFNHYHCTRWAPTSYKWNYNPYNWPYKWVNGVITLLIRAINPFITGRAGAHLAIDEQVKGETDWSQLKALCFFFQARFHVEYPKIMVLSETGSDNRVSSIQSPKRRYTR